jgi:photosystem II stability/assembly factor-like uncharacterized protein
MTNDRLTESGREDRGSPRQIPIEPPPKGGAVSRAFGAAIVVFALTVSAATAGENAWTTNGPNGGAAWSLAVDPSTPSTIYAGADNGIFKSEDGGTTWRLVSASVLSASCLAVDPLNRVTLYAGTEAGLMKSTDAGAHFDLHAEVATPIAAIAFDRSDQNIVYAGGRGPTIDGLFGDFGSGNVYVSFDGQGRHWRLDTTRVVDSIASLLAASFDGLSSTVIAGTDVSMSYYPGVGAVIGGVNGGDWARLVDRSSYGETSISAVRALAGDGDAIFAGTTEWHWDGDFSHPQFPAGAVLRSLDQGTTWRRFPLGLRAAVSSLAVDPTTPTTLYAGTDHGVFWSADSGESWTPLLDGLTDLHVTSLAIDPRGSSLHAGTPAGVFDLDLPIAVPAFPCGPEDRHLCLLGGRFRVGIVAHDETRDRTTSGHAVSQGDRFGYFSFPDFTGDPSLPEVVVKMVDASGSSWRSFWFFHSSLTNLDYVVTVTDTVTGRIRAFHNVPISPYCGAADTASLPGDVSTPSGSVEAASLTIAPEPAQSSLSLLSGRFTVSISATKPSTGETTRGRAIPQEDRFGYFSLPDFMGDPNFPEVFVKMVDATSFSGSYWVFFTGLTSLPYTLTVSDTVTGKARTYESEGGISLCGGADTEAFATEALPGARGGHGGFSFLNATIGRLDAVSFGHAP